MADYTRKLRVLFASSDSEFGRTTGGPGTLQGLIQQILGQVPLTRGYVFGDKSIYLLHESDQPEGVYLHLVVYRTGGAVTAFGDPGHGHPAQMDPVPPPTNKQYIGSTYTFLIDGNDIVACRSGTNTDAPFVSWVWQAAAQIGVVAANFMFDLKHRANVNRLAAIQTDGIKSLTFNGAASLGAIQQANRTTARESVVGAVVDQVKSMFGAGMAPALADNTKVEVKFTVDQRTAAVAHDPLILAAATKALQDNAEGFRIVTASDKQFTSEDVLLSRDAKMTPLGVHPDHVSAWQQLKRYQDDL